MHRSHRLQELLNYFPDTDPRVREGASTLDAQLLNAFATAIEDQESRFRRELDARFLATCPLNLDNHGVWHRLIVPPGQSLDNNAIRGCLKDGRVVDLQPFDEGLPVPARIEADLENLVPCENPVVFSLDGDGNPVELSPAPLEFPNRISVEAVNLGLLEGVVDVTIEGIPYPEPVSLTPAGTVSERLVFLSNGLQQTRLAWSRITRISLHGLPAGGTLNGYLFSCLQPQQLDPERSYAHPAYRDRTFDRHWAIDGRLLKEVVQINPYSGFETVQSYRTETQLVSFATVPNTQLLLAATETGLHVADRREPMPEKLERTGITEEPYYNLLVWPDPTATGNTRRVIVQPLENALSRNAHKWRILVEIPGSENDTMYVVTPDGALVPPSAGAGWRTYSPEAVTLPLVEEGTYLFTLESADSSGHVTRDYAAHRNQYFRPLKSFDLSADVAEIRGVFFDSRQRPWIWTGYECVPLVFHYDAYVIDPSSRSVYVTEPFVSVQIGADRVTWENLATTWEDETRSWETI
jgi:hypothetical protein